MTLILFQDHQVTKTDINFFLLMLVDKGIAERSCHQLMAIFSFCVLHNSSFLYIGLPRQLHLQTSLFN